jgi:hypothetical protein
MDTCGTIHHTMEDRVDLLVTVVLVAEDERAARRACAELRGNVDGRIVESADCTAEEPECWSVTMRVPTEERATHNVGAPLARAVRQFVRTLGHGFDTPRVACEPPTAWTVVDDPEALAALVPGAERLLVEAWFGGDPYPPAPDEPEPAWPEFGPDDQQDDPDDESADEYGDEPDDEPGPEDEDEDEPEIPAQAAAEPEPVATRPADHPVSIAAAPIPVTKPMSGTVLPPVRTTEQPVTRPTGPAHAERRPNRPPAGTGTGGCHLTLTVDVLTDRESGAEWQARAVASRISRTAQLTGITQVDGILRVHVDLGDAPTSAPQTVLTAVSALDRKGWSALRWEGETAITNWNAAPRPTAGIIALELSSRPGPKRRKH